MLVRPHPSGYTSGATDFDTYTAATTHAGLSGTGFTNTSSNGPQQFSFDLGAVVSIDALAIWNTSSVGAVNSIRILADNDQNFGNGTGAVLLGASALGGAGPAHVFSFGAISTRFIHVEGLNSAQPPDFYGLGEVVFRSTDVPTDVPEPATVALLGIGALGLIGWRRRTA